MTTKLQNYIFDTKKKFIYFFLKKKMSILMFTKNIYIYCLKIIIKKMVSKYLDMNFNALKY